MPWDRASAWLQVPPCFQVPPVQALLALQGPAGSPQMDIVSAPDRVSELSHFFPETCVIHLRPGLDWP